MSEKLEKASHVVNTYAVRYAQKINSVAQGYYRSRRSRVRRVIVHPLSLAWRRKIYDLERRKQEAANDAHSTKGCGNREPDAKGVAAIGVALWLCGIPLILTQSSDSPSAPPEVERKSDPWVTDTDQTLGRLSRVLDPFHNPEIPPQDIDEMFWRCPICDRSEFHWRAPRHICDTTWSSVSEDA